MVTINETGREEPPKIFSSVNANANIHEEAEEEGHDGWGPIRPRRSSMPPDHPDAHDHDTIPMICLPKIDQD